MNDHDGVLTHLDEQGAARMVDVSAKAVTLRRARASGAVLMKPSTLDMICHGTAAKGDVIATARIAGIMAAKRTGELIPLCHPLGIEAVTVTLEPQGADRLSIAATVTTVARTGVEMEALTAVTAIFHRACEAVMPGGVLAWESLALSGAEAGTASAKRRVKPGEPACLLPADFTVVHEGQGNCDSAPSRIMIARRSPLPGA